MRTHVLHCVPVSPSAGGHRVSRHALTHQPVVLRQHLLHLRRQLLVVSISLPASNDCGQAQGEGKQTCVYTYIHICIS